MLNIQYDTVLYIASFLYNINDYKNMMLINKEIYGYLDNFEYKRIRLMRELNSLSIKYSAIEHKNDDDLYYPSSFNNPWNVYSCISNSCPYSNVSVGVAYTYCVGFNNYRDYCENNVDFIKNKKYTRRYIPYCRDCMETYINGSMQSRENNYIIALSYLELIVVSV